MSTAEVEQSGETGTENGSPPSRTAAAPYMPGRSFTGMFNKYASEGLPDVFDISFFGNISGSTIAQTRSTMRYFDLIDDAYVPTQLMRDLVEADEDNRAVMLKSLVEDKYADALALSQNATSGQLAKIFSDRGISGATVDKAIAFYLHILDYVGIPYSGNFKKRRTSNSGARRRASRKADPSPPAAPAPPKTRAPTEEEQKALYVQTLIDLAKREDGDAASQSGIFDRIERALGILPPPTAAGRGTTDSP